MTELWEEPQSEIEVKLEKIKSMKCIDPKARIICAHLWTKSVALGGKCIPYYCDEKQKEIINPKGKKKCKQFEKSPRMYLATHY